MFLHSGCGISRCLAWREEMLQNEINRCFLVVEAFIRAALKKLSPCFYFISVLKVKSDAAFQLRVNYTCNL